MNTEIIRIFLYFFAFAVSLYSFWFIASEEGFLRGHIFDCFILLSIPAFALAYFFGAVFAVAFFLIFTFLYSKVRHWSHRKLGDILSIPVMSFLFLLSLAQKNLFLIGSLSISLAILIFMRKSKSFSKSSSKVVRMSSLSKLNFNGALFNACLILLGTNAILFEVGESTVKALFYVVLILLSLIYSFMEIKNNPTAKNSVKDLFAKAEKFLVNKKEELDEQEKNLKLEDSYKVAGRADDNADVLDDAQEDSLHEVTMQSLSVVEKAIAQVQKALKRLKMGKYGICEKCGEKIDPARLKAYPETTVCLDCSSRK